MRHRRRFGTPRSARRSPISSRRFGASRPRPPVKRKERGTASRTWRTVPRCFPVHIINQEYELVPVDALKPHPQNPRRGDTVAIAESIVHNGFYGAVVAQKSTGLILAGNHRWKAAKDTGGVEIPTIWVECDDHEALKILLADNRTNDLAEYDAKALAAVLSQVIEGGAYRYRLRSGCGGRYYRRPGSDGRSGYRRRPRGEARPSRRVPREMEGRARAVVGHSEHGARRQAPPPAVRRQPDTARRSRSSVCVARCRTTANAAM